jgi:hypothetical protein
MALTAKDDDAAGINARLVQAAETGETLELILVLRGKVRPVRSGDRWRVRTDRRHVLTFRADAVVAATPMPRPPRSSAR